MKDCEKIRKLLGQYLDGRLLRGKMADVENHLINCPECRGYFENLKNLESFSDDFQFEGNTEYWEGSKEKILARLPETSEIEVIDVRKKRRAEFIFRFTAVAASITLVAFISYYEGWYKKDIPDQMPSQPFTGEKAAEQEMGKQAEPTGVFDIEEGRGVEAPIVTPEPSRPAEDTHGKTELKIETPVTLRAPAVPAMPEVAPAEKLAEQYKETEPTGTAMPAEKPAVIPTQERLTRENLTVAGTRYSDKPKKAAESAQADKLAKIDESVQHFRLAELHSNLAPADTVDLTEYISWRSRSEYLSARYAQYLSPHYPEAAAKQREELSSDSLDAIFSEIAEAFFNVGRLTPDSSEKKEMMSNLQRLRDRSDASNSEMIQKFISALQSATK